MREREERSGAEYAWCMHVCVCVTNDGGVGYEPIFLYLVHRQSGHGEYCFVPPSRRSAIQRKLPYTVHPVAHPKQVQKNSPLKMKTHHPNIKINIPEDGNSPEKRPEPRTTTQGGKPKKGEKSLRNVKDFCTDAE